MRVVADRVGALLGQDAQFGGVGQELPAYRVVGPLDQRGDAGWHGDAVERRTSASASASRGEARPAAINSSGRVRVFSRNTSLMMPLSAAPPAPRGPLRYFAQP